MDDTITISREFNNELCETIEDTIAYVIQEFANNGEFVSGETAYKLLECFAVAKQAEFNGELM